MARKIEMSRHSGSCPGTRGIRVIGGAAASSFPAHVARDTPRSGFSEDDLRAPCDPVDCRAAPSVRAAIELRIVDNDMFVIEHELHVQVGIPVDSGTIGCLLGAAIGRPAPGDDTRDRIGGAEYGGLEVAIVEIDDAEPAGEFERTPARAAKEQGALGNDAGIGAGRGIVETLAADRIARLHITTVEVERGAWLTPRPAAGDARGRRNERCRTRQRIDDVVIILALNEEVLEGRRGLAAEDLAPMGRDVAGVEEISRIDTKFGPVV